MLHHTRPWPIALGALFALACSPGTPPGADPVVLPDGGPGPAEVDAAPLLEPRLWVPPAPFEGPCPEGSLVTPAGCGQVWQCPDGWLRAVDGFACQPPTLPQCADDGVALPDGTCLDPWACPEGWLPDADGACLPVVAECPDSAPVPGGCLPVLDCERAPPADMRWVNAAAAPGGDGSAARPFADLGAAFAGGADRVALASGRHAWPDGPHPAGALIWGACPAQVELVAAVAAGDLTLDGVHLVGAEAQPALTVEGGAIRVVGGRASGPSHVMRVAGGSLTLVDSAVGPGERGLVVDAGAVEVAGVVFADLAGNAVRVAAGAVARLDRVYGRNTVGLVVGGRATGADLQWVQTDGQALGVMPGGVMEVERVAITWPDGPLGLGALVSDGELTARDLTVLGAAGAGVQAQDPATRVRLERAWIGRVAPAGQGPMWAVGAVSGARVQLQDVRVDRWAQSGVAAFGEVAAVGLRVTSPVRFAETTVAILATTGGRFTGRRIAWSAASGLGLWAGSEGAVEVEVAAGQGATGAAVVGAQAGTLRLTDAALAGGGTAVIDAGFSSANPGEGPTVFAGERLTVQAGPETRGVLACRARVELADAVIDGGEEGLRLIDSSSTLARVAVSGFSQRGLATESDPMGDVCGDGSEVPDEAGVTAVDFGAIDGGVYGVEAVGGAVFGGDLAIGAGSPPASAGTIARVGASIELDRARVRSVVGLVADGGRVSARGVFVDGAVGPAPAVQSPGALAQEGGRLELEQARVVGATGAAVGAAGGLLTARDLRVEQNRGLAGGNGGVGLSVTDGGTADVARVHLVDNRGFGLTTHAAALVLVDGVIERTAPDGPVDGQRGIGAGFFGGSGVTVDGLVLRDNHTGGLVVGGPTFEGRRILVEGTRPARAGGPADGVVIDAPSTATLTDFVVRDQPGAGVVVSGAAVGLQGGRIEGNGVGLLTRNAARVSAVGVVFAGNDADELCESACLDGSVGAADP